MSAPKVFKKIWDITSTAIVIMVVLCAVFLMGSRLIGFQAYSVLSGSMEPAYSVGDLLYVWEKDPEDIKVGDTITFVLNEDLDLATHRVESIDAEKRLFITKGDANDNADQKPVKFENYKGITIFSLPLLGYVSNFIQNPPGLYITIGLAVLLAIVVFLPDLLKKKKGKDEPATAAETTAEVTAPVARSEEPAEENTTVSDAEAEEAESGIKEEAANNEKI